MKAGPFWLALVSAWVLASVAHPQEPSSEEPSAPPGEVDEITVTGTASQVTNVQDEAQAITAFSMDDLDRANIVNVDGLAFSVPGLHVGQQGQQAIVTLRGIGTENATITGEPGVAFHVDGINYARPAAARVSFFDLEGIQVLRGPQGTKGGKNTTAGSIHLITRKPTDDFEVTGDFLYGNYDRTVSRGAVNVPINEFAAVRGSFIFENRDGYLQNLTLGDNDRDAFDADTYGLRTHLRLTPIETLEILGTYHYFGEKGNGPQSDLVPLDTTCPEINFLGFRREAFDSTLPRLAVCLGPGQETAIAETDPRAIYVNDPSAQDNRYWGWTTAWTLDLPYLERLGPTQLKFLSGYQATDIEFKQDFDATSLRLVDIANINESEQYSGELQWSSSGSERVDWQLSAFYMHEESEASAAVSRGQFEGKPLSSMQSTENSAYGAALHTDWYLTDTLTLSLGGRFSKDKKRTNLLRDNQTPGEFGGRVIGCTGVLDFGPGGVPDDPPPWCSRKDRHFTGGAGLEMRPTDASLLYARVDRGFKSGGYNVAGFGDFDPEYIWSYAIGGKSTFFDELLTFNFEGFYYDYTDLQLLLIDGLKFRVENSDAQIFGGEIELQVSPIDGLRLSGVVSYLHTKVIDYHTLDPAGLEAWEQGRLLNRSQSELRPDDFAPFLDRTDCAYPQPGSTRLDINQPCVVDDFSGNSLSRSPEWTFTLSAEYDIFLGPYGTLTPRIQYYWQDETYFRPFQKEFDLQDDYHKTDAKLIWLSPSARWNMEVFVSNIEDDAVIQNLIISSRVFGSPPQAWYGEPRYYGVRVGFKY